MRLARWETPVTRASPLSKGMEMVRLGFAFCVCCLSLALLTGCGGGPQVIDAEYVRSNPTPELSSIAYTEDEFDNQRARTFNTQFRSLSDDWQIFWMLERPHRFSYFPIP